MWSNAPPRQGYAAPPPAQNYYQPPPPPQPTYQQQQQYSAPPPPAAAAIPYAAPLDPFRTYYADRLRELTFNSRPIIQDLSMIAMTQRNENNWTNMQAVVDEIEAATLRSLPTEKLPKLYLIDSISKNIGSPYTTHLLPPIIPRLYARIYREVDGVTKSKMEEMIGLWRSGAPDGTDLYGATVREAVERDIFGSMGYQRSSAPTREKVAATMRAALEYHHRESANRPWDTQASQNLQVLMQLNQLLSAGALGQSDLQMIMDKLTAMAPKPATPMPAPTLPTPPMQQSSYTPPPQPAAYHPPPQAAQAVQSGPTLPPFPPSMPPGHLRVSSGGGMPPPTQTQTPPQYGQSPLPPPSSTPQPSSAPNAIPSNVLDILRNLNTSGILAAPRTPDPSTPALPRSKMDDYEDMILSLDVKLSELNLNRMHELPLAHLPERCTQCFLRFPERGSKFEAHMDWHFRRNKQERQSEGRGAHRRWLPRGEDWVNDIPNAEAGPSTSPSKATAEATSKLNLEALRKRWVKVPSDPVLAARPCPICKEPFKSEWSEEEETWVWRNAIEVNGKIYHATCRAELLENRRLAKLKGGGSSRSLSKSKSPGSTPFPDFKDVKKELGSTSVPGAIGAGGGSHLRTQTTAESGTATPTEDSAVNVKAEPVDTPSSTAGKRKVEDEGVDENGDGAETKRVKVEPIADGGNASDQVVVLSDDDGANDMDAEAAMAEAEAPAVPEVIVEPPTQESSKSSRPSEAAVSDALREVPEGGGENAEEDMVDEQVSEHSP